MAMTRAATCASALHTASGPSPVSQPLIMVQRDHLIERARDNMSVASPKDKSIWARFPHTRAPDQRREPDIMGG